MYGLLKRSRTSDLGNKSRPACCRRRYYRQSFSLFSSDILPSHLILLVFSFCFQAEDGIRDLTVTGVQTCALPIFGEHELAQTVGLAPAHADDAHGRGVEVLPQRVDPDELALHRDVPGVDGQVQGDLLEIGRASCRERV